MTTALDTNLLVALLKVDDTLNSLAKSALDAAFHPGNLVVSPPVFAELLAYPTCEEELLERFFRETGIAMDWEINEPIWRLAGHAFQQYSARRKKHNGAGPRLILADCVIGAHAQHNGYALLTLDGRVYHAAFPRLRMLSV